MGQAYEERDSFTDADLVRFFGNEEFEELRGRHEDSYWIVLLLLHSGARLREIAQLYGEDVVLDIDTPYFAIDDRFEGQTLKTKSSRRKVPFHPVLLQNGLASFLATRKVEAGTGKFWQGLSWGKNGPGERIGKWFNTRCKDLQLGPKKTLHSLRHTVATKLSREGVPSQHIAYLEGHALAGMTDTRYVKPLSPSELSETVVRRLRYTEIWAAFGWNTIG